MNRSAIIKLVCGNLTNDGYKKFLRNPQVRYALSEGTAWVLTEESTAKRSRRGSFEDSLERIKNKDLADSISHEFESLVLQGEYGKIHSDPSVPDNVSFLPV